MRKLKKKSVRNIKKIKATKHQYPRLMSLKKANKNIQILLKR